MDRDLAVPEHPVVPALGPALVRVDRVVPVVPVVGEVSPVAVVVDRVDPAELVVLEVPVVPAVLGVLGDRAVLAAAVALAVARVVVATPRVHSASPVVARRAGASPSAPSAKNSTTWKHRPSVAFGCREVVARPFGCRAVLR